MINSRLTWHLETLNLLSPHQFGFRKNRSTSDPLTIIHTSICKELEKKNHLLMVSLDIAKAYDTVWVHRVLSTLHKWNFKGKILNFINNFLTDRTFEVKFRHTISSTFGTENGLPQGSSLSVTLFLIAINDISNKITRENFIICRRLQPVSLWIKHQNYQLTHAKINRQHQPMVHRGRIHFLPLKVPIHFIQSTEENPNPRDKNARKYPLQRKKPPPSRINIRPQT